MFITRCKAKKIRLGVLREDIQSGVSVLTERILRSHCNAIATTLQLPDAPYYQLPCTEISGALHLRRRFCDD